LAAGRVPASVLVECLERDTDGARQAELGVLGGRENLDELGVGVVEQLAQPLIENLGAAHWALVVPAVASATRIQASGGEGAWPSPDR